MNKLNIYIIVSILIIYYIFTSGSVFEAIQSTAINKLDIPYSIGLSAERTGLTNIASRSDIECMQWLKDNYNGKPVLTDYNSYCLITGFIPVFYELNYGERTGFLEELPEEYFTEGLADEGNLAERIRNNYPVWTKSGCFVFISSWNTRHQQYIESTGVGTKLAFPLPEFSYPLLKQCGDTKIYWKPEPSKG